MTETLAYVSQKVSMSLRNLSVKVVVKQQMEGKPGAGCAQNGRAAVQIGWRPPELASAAWCVGTQ